MKTDTVRLEHMLEAINEIIAMTENGDQDRKTELAVTRLIEIIGEAARHVSPELKACYPRVFHGPGLLGCETPLFMSIFG